MAADPIDAVDAVDAAQVELLQAFRRTVRGNIERDLQRERRRAQELRDAVLPVVRAGLERARQRGLVTQAWLFGSFAWGNPTDRSDVDLLVQDCSNGIEAAVVIGENCPLELHVVRWELAPETLRRRAVAEGTPL